jgi:hypothetical protein
MDGAMPYLSMRMASVQNPSDALYGKNIFIQRAFYKPVTNTHLDIAARGLKHFIE